MLHTYAHTKRSNAHTYILHAPACVRACRLIPLNADIPKLCCACHCLQALIEDRKEKAEYALMEAEKEAEAKRKVGRGSMSSM